MIRVYRGEIVESSHHVHVAVVDAKGNLVWRSGDAERPTFIRSSMKPFQAVPLVETGAAAHFDYQMHELAISCASHNGEDFHRRTVQGILDKIGLGVEDLQCGMHPPRKPGDYEALLRSGGSLSPLFSNCSGKHAGMLATAVYMKEDIQTYREIGHPVQQRILKAISELLDTDADQIGLAVDGCGVPVHCLPLHQAAFGYAQLAAGHSERHPHHDEALRMIRDAMMARPEMVAGTDRFDTDIMRLFPGKVVAKAGAEGVQCLGLVEAGLGIAIKCEDGNPRALSAVTLTVLEEIGFADPAPDDETYRKYRHPKITNMRGDAVGRIDVELDLRSK
ncbi:asparaginase [Caenibacillus caldisaponilyticus]|uniref:asparaginase n=1 Tax=Caenibacillus caldisaponilyticus TaxID=1674942 RepID=UPI0009885228|nr:asparaginase [Caenibacillus caldisaponilyticus]